MKVFLPSFTGAALMVLATIFSASGESATFGWQTTKSRGSYATDVYMQGPIARNKPPEKKGVFKGEFVSRAGEWQSKLTAIYKLSLDQNRELQSRKVGFTILPVSSSDTVETNGWRGVKIHFATEDLSFEPEQSFLLIFESKVTSPDGMKDEMGMVMLRIIRLFIPS